MGAKWSTVSTTTYADNSPADDGTATEANRVKLATIKSDLTDPLDAAIDAIVANLDELFDESATAISTNYTTVASDHAKILEVTNGTITLLAAGTAGAGYRVGVHASGADITVSRSASDTINGYTSVTVNDDTISWFYVNAAGNGYITEQKGARIATGTYTGDGTTSQAITGVGFPPKFVMISPNAPSEDAYTVWWTFDTLVDDMALGAAIFLQPSQANSILNNRIRSLNADGFTVSDDNLDAAPNATGAIYNYLAIG